MRGQTVASRLFGSIRSVDPLDLGGGSARLLAAGVDGLHVDVADGHFVPELAGAVASAGALVTQTGAAVEVHLMVTAPESYLHDLAESGVWRVAVHLEATPYPWRTCRLARSVGLEVGLAVNPSTAISALAAAAPAADFVNLLTTEPDLAGERFIAGMTQRVAEARAALPSGVRIEVDGGITLDSMGELARAGANEFVIGRAITETDNWQENLDRLRAASAGGPRRPTPATT